MKQAAYCIFETPLGWCGIAWREGADSPAPPAVTCLQLPEATAKMTESRIAQRSGARKPSAPPPRIAEIIERVCRHFRGEIQDFRDVSVDLAGADSFARQVYEAARNIPAGQTKTYGEIAKELGQPSAARDVGQALARNPIGLIVPCHRVVAAGGKTGGFSARGGPATKTKILALEGVSQPRQSVSPRASHKTQNQLAFDYPSRNSSHKPSA
jgi:O-6-methylguanine DNA methyltransferase